MFNISLPIYRDVKPAPSVAPICLPPVPDPSNIIAPTSSSSATAAPTGAPGSLGTVVGWGRVGRFDGAPHSSVLQAASVPVLSDDECFLQTGLFTFADQLCAGSADSDTSACPGDSGGALQEQDDKGRYETCVKA